MFLKPLTIGAVLACGVLAVTGLHLPPGNGCPGARLLSHAQASALADTRKDDKPALSGAWAKKEGELRIEFGDNGVLKIAPHGDRAVIAIVCNYTVDKKGRVKAEITGFEGKKEEARKKIAEHLPVGLEFSFKWTVKGDAAKLADVKGDKVPEKLKTHLEGDFKKKQR
jgi:hypothetical protein